jgi:hypothetical protein
MIQRPGYPLYSLSLTAAIVYLIYQYKCDYYVDGYLIDTLILEKIKEILHFVKKCWNFNSAKFLKKIEQTKSYNCELIFFTLIHVIHVLDLSIISSIFFVINIPYIIYLAIIVLYISIVASLINTIDILSLLYNFLYCSIWPDLSALLFYIILFPTIFLLLFIILIPPYTFYCYFETIRGFVCKIIELYKKDDGFCNVMNFFWVLIIFPFLYLIDNSYFIYVVCRINLRYERCLKEEIREILE